MTRRLLCFACCLIAAAARSQAIPPQITVDYMIAAGQVTDIQAVDAITARNVVGRSATVSYTAGKAITLTPGFEARAGSVFQAVIAQVKNPAAEVRPELVVSATPNPFQMQTLIDYKLPEAGWVNYTLTDERGGLIRQYQSEGVQSVGSHRMGVDGTGLAAGVYLYQIPFGRQTKTIRLLKQ